MGSSICKRTRIESSLVAKKLTIFSSKSIFVSVIITRILDLNMIHIYYNSKSIFSNNILNYLNKTKTVVIAIDIIKAKLTDSQWEHFSEKLGVDVEHLIDKNAFSFELNPSSNLGLDQTDWIKILNDKPEVVSYPIAIIGNHYFQLKNLHDVEKLLKSISLDH